MYVPYAHTHAHTRDMHTHTSLRWKKWKNPVRGADCPCLLTALKREICVLVSERVQRGSEGSERGQRGQRVQRVQRGDRGFREGSEGSER